MATMAYLRVSKDSQDVRNQRLAILEFARQESLEIDEFMELSISSRRSAKERQIDRLRSQNLRSVQPLPNELEMISDRRRELINATEGQ